MPSTTHRIVHGALEPFTADGFLPDEPARLIFMVLHGAGESSRRYMHPICRLLAAHGYAAWTFDAYGQGDSTIDIATTSLVDRHEQALAVARSLPGPLGIFSFSRGGQTALALLQDGLDIRQMVLFAPAATDRAADTAKFGPAFHKITHVPESWRASRAFELIKDFTGGLTLVWGTADTDERRQIAEAFYTNAVQASSRALMPLTGVRHTLNGLFKNNPRRATEIVCAIIDRIEAARHD